MTAGEGSAGVEGAAGRPAIAVATRGPDQTQAVAAALVPFIRAGDVLLLGGDLGAGKTCFTKGLAHAAGVGEVVTSPTFTLVRHYRTSIGIDLLHADVYRLEQLNEVVDLGLAELVEDGAFAVIEWGNRAAPAFGDDLLRIDIALGETEDDRLLTLSCVGSRWSACWDAVRSALEAGFGCAGGPAWAEGGGRSVA